MVAKYAISGLVCVFAVVQCAFADVSVEAEKRANPKDLKRDLAAAETASPCNFGYWLGNSGGYKPTRYPSQPFYPSNGGYYPGGSNNNWYGGGYGFYPSGGYGGGYGGYGGNVGYGYYDNTGYGGSFGTGNGNYGGYSGYGTGYGGYGKFGGYGGYGGTGYGSGYGWGNTGYGTSNRYLPPPNRNYYSVSTSTGRSPPYKK